MGGVIDRPPRAAVLFAKGVSRTYPGTPAVKALRPVTLVVEAGEHIGLMGRSGSGKSTLLNLLGLLDRPSAGAVYVEGADTEGLPDAARARLRADVLGFVFQEYYLMPGRSALENVVLGMLYTGVSRGDRAERASEALRVVGLAHRNLAQPNQLSGGERQRVAIARAIAGSPRVLLCDEPTGNLDSKSSSAVLDVLDGLRSQGVAIVTATHSTEVADRADRIIELVDGQVLAA